MIVSSSKLSVYIYSNYQARSFVIFSETPIQIRWVWRQSNASNRAPWPHRVTGCCSVQCGGFCTNRCGGLCHMSPQGGVIEDGASFPVDMEVKSEGFEPGKYSAVLG